MIDFYLLDGRRRGAEKGWTACTRLSRGCKKKRCTYIRLAARDIFLYNVTIVRRLELSDKI